MNLRKCLQRMCKFVQKRFNELNFEYVEDPRERQGRRFELPELLRLLLTSLMVGRQSLAQVESFSEWIPRSTQKKLKLPGRVADTTLRDLLCQPLWTSLRTLLHQAIRRAQRRKALPVQVLPFHMIAMDGKATSFPIWDDTYVQKQKPDPKLKRPPYGLLRTTTATLVTAPSKPCVDVSPIPAHTNETGHFQHAFEALVETFGDLFTLVSYDAGAGHEKNGRCVVDAGKHYLFRLNDPRWDLYQLALDLCRQKEPMANRVDVLNNHKEVRRTVRLVSIHRKRLPPLARKSFFWEHAKTLILVETQMVENTAVMSHEQKLYISSLEAAALTPKQWLWATVGHWGVETTHQILDTAFDEDDHPWVETAPEATLSLIVLRRVAYTLLTLFRSVAQRSEENRLRPWKDLLEHLFLAMLRPMLEDTRLPQVCAAQL